MKTAIMFLTMFNGQWAGAAPTLTAPAAGAVLDDTTPDFSWAAVAGAVSYDIEIAETLTGTPTATGIAALTYTPGAPLDALLTYSWRVRAVNAGGAAGAWSATRTFTFEINVTAPTITPTLSAELLANGTFETGSPPTSWIAINNAALSSQSDARPESAGTKSIQIARNGTNQPYATQIEAVTVSQWLYLTAWQKNIDASGGIRAQFQDGVGFAVNCSDSVQTATDWTQVHGTGRSLGTGNGAVRLYANGTVDAQSGRFDDVSLKTITFASTLATVGSRSIAVGNYECHPVVVAGTQAGLVVRYTDANNFVIAIIDRGYSPARASLWKVIAGTWTAVVAATNITYADGTPLRVSISGSGTTFSLYYNNVQVGADQTVSDSLGTGVYAFSAYGGNEVGNVTTFPFDVVFFAVGDSKTVTTPWQGYFTTQTYAATSERWVERPNRFATAGYTVADMLTYVNANLAGAQATPAPDYILANLGANDVKNLPAEATLKTNYIALLDALHTKWPSAQIGLMRVWRDDYPAQCDTFDGWVDDIIPQRDFLFTGPDERIFLENGDNGVTYTLDGTHPNDAGRALTAAQWQSVILALP